MADAMSSHKVSDYYQRYDSDMLAFLVIVMMIAHVVFNGIIAYGICYNMMTVLCLRYNGGFKCYRMHC